MNRGVIFAILVTAAVSCVYIKFDIEEVRDKMDLRRGVSGLPSERWKDNIRAVFNWLTKNMGVYKTRTGSDRIDKTRIGSDRINKNLDRIASDWENPDRILKKNCIAISLSFRSEVTTPAKQVLVNWMPLRFDRNWLLLKMDIHRSSQVHNTKCIVVLLRADVAVTGKWCCNCSFKGFSATIYNEGEVI